MEYLVDAPIIGAAKDFWRKKLSPGFTKASLPASNLAVSRGNERIVSFEFREDLVAGLLKLCGKSDKALHACLFSAIALLIARLTGMKDLTLGMPVSKDTRRTQTAGGILPVRVNIDHRMTFKELLLHVRENILLSEENRDDFLPEVLEKELQVGSADGESPWFDMIVLLDSIHHTDRSDDLKSDIIYKFQQRPGSIKCTIVFNPALYSSSYILQLGGHLQNLLRRYLDDVEQPVVSLKILTGEEERQVKQFNDRTATYNADCLINELFQEQVEKTRDCIAVSCGDHAVTYGFLNQISNVVAHTLLAEGFRPGEIAGLMTDRSVDMIVGLLGIVKAGGGYMPLSNQYPEDRIKFMIGDSRPSVLIVNGGIAAPQHLCKTLVLEEIVRSGRSFENPEGKVSSQDAVYVIYTSGSTGNPKGVIVTHKNVHNLLAGLRQQVYSGYTGQLRVSLVAPLEFDASVQQIAGALLQGYHLIIVPKDTRFDGSKLWRFYHYNRVDVSDGTPTHVRMLTERPAEDIIKKLRISHFLIAGEAFHKSLAEKFYNLWQSNVPAITNLYGPTETCVDSVAFDITPENLREYTDIPIGRPLANQKVYILNDLQQLQPVGMQGELYIGGDGVSLGYVASPELTAKRFVANPIEDGGGMVYRTGDLARWLPGGLIQFLGRIDKQVKINGYRIEPEEVEQQISRMEGIKAAAVLAQQSENGQKLVAYVVPDDHRGALITRLLEIRNRPRNDFDNLAHLPNGWPFFCYNRNEVKEIFKEIFESNPVEDFAIFLPENPVIMDIGANVGMFSLYIQQYCSNPLLYAIEPVPHLCRLLKLNMELYSLNVRILELGIGETSGGSSFVFYPNSSGMSGRYTNREDDSALLRKVIANNGEVLPPQMLNEIINQRLVTEEFATQIKSISQLIDENRIERIDLLKIDVEKGELDALKGVADKDWIKISSLLIEIHDIDGRLETIIRLLRNQGYTVKHQQEQMYRGTGLFTVFAERASPPAGYIQRANRFECWKNPQEMVDDVREYLVSKLPVYMIPASIEVLRELPLTLNGKVDYKRLTEVEGLAVPDHQPQFASPLQQTLASIWEDILEAKGIRPTDDFFIIGGNSITAIKVVAAIYKKLNVKIPLSEIFRSSTIQTLSEAVDKLSTALFVPIPPTPLKSCYPLSYSQRRLYFLNQLHQDSTAYNIPQAICLRGPVSKEKLESVLQKLIERHESLRTSIHFSDDEPVQVIHSHTDFSLAYSDAQGLSSSAIQDLIRDFIKPFDLTTSPLLRGALVKTDVDSHILIIDLHHIISDGASQQILIRDFIDIYLERSIAPLKSKYRDFAEWQSCQPQQNSLAKQESFWVEQFQGDLPVLHLPLDGPRRMGSDMQGAKTSFTFDPDLERDLIAFAEREKVTLFQLLLAIFTTLLGRLSKQDDIVVGVPVVGREHPDLKDIVGLFVNTLPIRTFPQSGLSFHEYLGQVKKRTIAAFDNQAFAYERLVDKIVKFRDGDRNPLFDVMLVFHEAGLDVKDIQLPGMHISEYPLDNRSSKFDLVLDVVKKNDLQFTLGFRRDLFHPETIDRFISFFALLSRSVVDHPEMPIGDQSIIKEEERQVILTVFNKTHATLPDETTILDRFEYQAQRHPLSIAVVHETKSIIYEELNRKANKLSELLAGAGVGKGDLIPLLMDKCIELPLAILAVQKCGAGFVPVDLEWPAQRLQYIITDLNPPLLLCNQQGFDLTHTLKDRRILVDSSALAASAENPRRRISQDDVIYGIYTSGTTGVPKNALNLQKGINNRFRYMDKVYGCTAKDSILFTSRHVFDASVWQMLWPLTNGAKVVLPANANSIDLYDLVSVISANRITITDFVPSVFQLFVEFIEADPALASQMSSLRQLLVGGEALASSLVKRCQRVLPQTGVTNTYGPSETSIGTVFFEMPKGVSVPDIIPIGKPIDNVKAVILDERTNLCPISTVGKLHLGGICVGMGYLNKPDETVRSFVKNPFPELDGDVLYNTGDLCSYMPDGNIRFIGRSDTQVKVNGIRIELGGIEAILRSNSLIEEVILRVVKRQSDQGDLLVAFLRSSSDKVTGQTIRSFLKDRLPSYSIPSQIKVLKTFPLTKNGKVDVRAMENQLSLADSGELTHYGHPVNETEKLLMHIWSYQLNVGYDSLGPHSNFFEVGGNSLQAIKLAADINRRLDRRITIKDIFTSPTVRDLAFVLKNTRAASIERIPTYPTRKYYPLSRSQLRFYDLYELHPQSIAYNLPSAYVFEGTIDFQKFENAFNKLARRQDVLRTRIVLVDGMPMQMVSDMSEFKVTLKESLEGSVAQGLKTFIRPFNLLEDPLVRIELSRVAHGKHVMFIDMHHIICDGVSHQILLNDFLNFYADGEPEELSLHYGDYAEWQHSEHFNSKLASQSEFWRKEFADGVPSLALPTDYPRQEVPDFDGDTISFKINHTQASCLTEIVRREKTTLFTVLLTITKIFLSKITNQRDIVVGAPVMGRELPELEKIAGLFINILPLRARINSSWSFAETLRDVQARVIRAFDHQDVPHQDIADALREPGHPQPRMFDVFFSLQDIHDFIPKRKIELPGLSVQAVPIDFRIAKFDLMIIAKSFDGHIKISFTYRKRLFKAATIRSLVCSFKQLMKRVTHTPTQKIGAVNLLSRRKKKETLIDFNNTVVRIPDGATVTAMFERQVKSTPRQEALRWRNGSFSYSELNAKANQLGRWMIENGVKPGDIVALRFEEMQNAVVAILAVLKVRATYMPIDAALPAERIGYLIVNAGCRYFMSDTTPPVDLPPDTAALQINDPSIASHGEKNLKLGNLRSDVAYIIYTSGSTGQPKGVVVENGSLYNYVRFAAKNYIKKGSVFALFTPISFDLTVTSVFAPLVTGNVLIAYPQHETVATLTKIIEDNEVNILKLTPSHLRLVLSIMESRRAASSIRQIIVGGERFESDLAQSVWRLFDGKIDIYNEYGPTEATVGCMIYRYDPAVRMDSVPIGRPIDNAKIYILDDDLQAVPDNVNGDLYISGSVLARGYLNRPGLTADVFLANSFNGHPLYKTGDVVRRNGKGTIEFIGRKDNQVKIRGYRVELSEIRIQLLQHESVDDAVVVANKDKFDDAFICAYFVSRSDADPAALRHYLSSRLPGYMVPGQFVRIDSVPLTSNGKVNYKQLPAPGGFAAADLEPPKTDVEKKLAVLWAKQLKAERIGANDNYFELGGDSIRVIRLAAMVHKEFNVQLDLRTFFTANTIKKLAVQVEVAGNKRFTSVQPAVKKEYYRLSSAQRRLYVQQHLEPHATTYNISQGTILTGHVSAQKLNRVFQDLIRLHESLRTSIHTVDGEPYQKIHASVPFAVEYHETSEAKLTLLADRFVRPFDLATPPFLRAGLFRIGDERYCLIVDMHHIISDGLSHKILLKDFKALYENRSLQPLRIQYKDFAEWQNARLPYIQQRHEQYWLSHFKTPCPPIELPTDYKRPAIQTFIGGNYRFSLDEESTQQLVQLVRKRNVTLFVLISSVYYVFLSKISGQNDVTIGTPVVGRQHADLFSIVGMFVNTLALRANPAGPKRFDDFMEEVKEVVVGAFDNQEYPYETLIEKTALTKDTSRNPLFDVFFSYQDTEAFAEEIDLNGLVTADYQVAASASSKFDLTLFAVERKGQFHFTFEFNRGLFKVETIEKLAGYFKETIHSIISSPQRRIDSIDILGDAETSAIIRKCAGSDCSYPENETIISLFERQSQATPDAVCAVYKDECITYSVLNRRVNQLANRLLTMGVHSQDIVPLFVEPSLNCAIAIYGVIKAGCCYLPIDNNLPPERVNVILSDSAPQIVITQQPLKSGVQFEGHVIDLLHDDPEVYPDHNPNVHISPDQLLYIIYTSGTTGVPKGVMIEHRNVVQLLFHNRGGYDFNRSDVWTMFHSYAFDFSVWEFFGATLTGGRLVFSDALTLKDPASYLRLLVQQRVTVLNQTPSAFYNLLSVLVNVNVKVTGIRWLIFGGETLKSEKLGLWRKLNPRCRIVPRACRPTVRGSPKRSRPRSWRPSATGCNANRRWAPTALPR